LFTKKVQLNSRFQNTQGSASSSRSQLFEAASKRNRLEDTDDEPIINSSAPVEVLRTEQKQIIKEQDHSLDNLSKTISRQKDIALRIGGEVDRQNDLLDDIAEQIDTTTVRMGSTTRGVEEVARRDSTWSLWLIIIALFGAIIVVLIL
jgi:syntaxin 8